MPFLLCDHGWCVHKSDVQNKWDHSTQHRRMEDTRLPKCVMFGELGVGGHEKKWMGCFLNDLRAFVINANQWTTAAAQGEGGKAQDDGTRGGTFHGEMDRCRESHDWTTACSSVCPSATGRIKERKAQSKRARTGSLAIAD